MSTDASTSLSPEIQQALEQAVVDANDAINISKRDKKEKKKKKRQRESDSAAATDANVEENKRKSKKKRHHEREGTEALDVPLTAQDSAQDGGVTGATSINLSDVVDIPPDPERKKKKKKEKKHKGKGKTGTVEETVEPSSVQIPSIDDTSSAEFLSAVVAAASATSGSSQQPQAVVPSDFHPLPPYPPYQGHYPYSPIGYPFPPPHPVYGHPQPAPPQLYPDLSGLPLADPTSSEDFLRTLQELDISKIASVLKSLGDAAAATNAQLNIPSSFAPVSPPGPPSVRQRPAKSDAILGRPPKPQKSAAKRTLPPSLSTTPPEPGDEGNPEHAHMLANVWMNASKLSEMVRKQGLVYKKGKFSAIEETQLTSAIENYRASRGLNKEQLTELIFSRDKGRDTFWPEITAALHLRPIIAVYHHVRRAYHPLNHQGRWMPSEDDALRRAVAEHGQQWSKISEVIGRMDSDCRDRYRNHLQNSEKRQTGHWSKEEEERLTQIVTEMTVQQGRDIDNDIFWGVVSEKMGGTRGRQQCRIKWTDSLSTQYKNNGERPRWSQMDAYLLVQKVDSLNVRDDSEIDWKMLPDEHWNSWSAHSLQRRWLTMKRSIKGHEEMTHTEIMDILRTKKAQLSSSPARKRAKKYTSAEAINDSEDDRSTPNSQRSSRVQRAGVESDSD